MSGMGMGWEEEGVQRLWVAGGLEEDEGGSGRVWGNAKSRELGEYDRTTFHRISP